jgi:mono/diheme cytochrome c family protein
MKQAIVFVAAACLAAALDTTFAQSSRTSAEGVYTAEQQKRGEAIYSRECSTCHGERLKGGEGSPPLTGTEFNDNWAKKTVADLFDKIKQTMPAPPEQPGKLSPQQTSDVVAHILSVAGFPTGSTELPSDMEQLKEIRISAGK